MASQSFQLVMQKGPNTGKIFELVQDELTIGRDITNRVVINDPEVSRRHAKLTAQMGGYTIEDLGSTNGTFVDGQRLTGPHLLRPGQTIMLGEKISLAYEALGFDPNATLVGAGPQAEPGPRETFRVNPDFDQPAAAPQRPPEPPAYAPPPPAYQPPAPVYQPPAQPAYQQPPYSAPSGPAYSGQVPAGPMDAYGAPAEVYEEPIIEDRPVRSNRTLVLAGCGILVVMLCCVVVALVAFDSLDLYCQPPFNALSGIIWQCP
jgi:pSer/pThr/pTyr-binding forkhead associated (FHA) protein